MIDKEKILDAIDEAFLDEIKKCFGIYVIDSINEDSRGECYAAQHFERAVKLASLRLAEARGIIKKMGDKE
jgi:hypothetical protein